MCRVHISIEDSWVTLVCKVSSHHLQSLTFIPLGKGEIWWALDFCNSQLYLKYICVQSLRDSWQTILALPLVQQWFPLFDRSYPNFHYLSCD